MSGCALDLSIVVPMFNEEDNVESIHGELRSVLDAVEATSEVIFVDDGSSDRTYRRLAELRRSDERVRIVRFRRNFGQTAAMQAGFDLARGRIVVTLDGDLQNDPRDIPRLVDGIRAGSDVVVGWRRNRRDRLLSRKIPSVCANWLIAKVTGIPIHDNGCSLKAYRREVLDRIRLYGEMHRFIPAMMSLSGCSVREIEVHHRPRRFGTSKYGISRTFKVVSDLVVVKVITGFTTRPSSWFALASLPFLAASVLFLGLAALGYAGYGGSGPTPVVYPGVAFLSAFAFLHLILVGTVAELVIRTGDYRESDAILVQEEEGATRS